MCGNLKLQGEFRTFNGVLITGDVKSISKTGFVLTTVGKSNDGREFVETHDVLMKGKKGFDIGNRVTMRGELDQIDTADGKRTKIVAHKVEKVDADAEYMNLARLVGPVHWYDYRSPTTTQREFGNVLVALGEKLFRAVVFNSLAATMDRDGRRGALVKMEGRLQNREYKDRITGNLQTMLEIATDSQRSAILVKAEANDPFAAFDEGEAPAEGDTAEIPI